MCLSIGGACEARRTPPGQAWWAIAGCPLRLFAAGGFLLLVTGTGALHAGSPGGGALLTGATALLLTGYLLKTFPGWSGKSPVHYLRYAPAALCLTTGLGLLPLSDARSLTLPAAAVALFGGWLAMSALHEHLGWMPTAHRPRAAAGVLLAYLLGGSALVAAVWS